MHEVFFKKLNEAISLTGEEEAIFRTYLLPKKLRKKQYILQEGDVCKYSIFVEKGLLRSYTISDKGNDQIVQFAPEGWWISDMYSFITGEPARYNIDALEDAELVLISNPGMEELRKQVPKFLEFSFLQMRNAYIAFERRLSYMVNLTTEEKYTKLVQTSPDIVQRVPQHMIASYLGLTPETLSRARKQMSNRK
ncbi:MAG: Crp/Fnr family transcriptional regulator [Ferruginibacter sp.]|nr:Crp/Fnr family transcriptional regulator [Ferruginibacter sp.]